MGLTRGYLDVGSFSALTWLRHGRCYGGDFCRCYCSVGGGEGITRLTAGFRYPTKHLQATAVTVWPLIKTTHGKWWAIVSLTVPPVELCLCLIPTFLNRNDQLLTDTLSIFIILFLFLFVDVKANTCFILHEASHHIFSLLFMLEYITGHFISSASFFSVYRVMSNQHGRSHCEQCRVNLPYF